MSTASIEPASSSADNLRAALEARRRPLAARVGDLERGTQPADVGLALGRAHAAVLDELLSELCRADPAELGGAAISLAGVGGYGRRALALGADLDLRLLTDDIERAEAAAQALLYPLWDSGLPVGHQVVSADDLIDASRTDLPTATSLLDWRFIAGDDAMSASLITRARAGVFALSELPAFFERLDAAAAQRHERYGGSVYMLEPDVKNGPGALRDVDVAWWAARARWNVGDFDELVRLGVLLPRQLAAVEDARERLWRVRNVLHHRAGRRSDRLDFDAQEAIAPLLGYPGPIGDAVEQMMSDFYRAARTVSRFRDMIIARATPSLKTRRPSTRDVDRGVVLFDRQATLVDQDLLESEPPVALRLVRAAVEHDVPIRPSIRSVLIRHSGDAAWTERLRDDPEASRMFIELVVNTRETALKQGSVMREMHDLGLLLAMVPEFAPVVGRVHHDTYHVYTVDVHSVAAVDRLGEIFRGDIVLKEQEEERWAGALAMRLASEIAQPHVLFFATFLHDIGKAIGRREHSERGAEMAEVILQRLGLQPRDIADVCRLILNHLAMYHLATRRDLDDDATHRDVAALMGDREGLRNLYLLTVADLSTTSPTSMTSWKARMLDELYLATEQWFDREDTPSDEQRRCQALEQVIACAGDPGEAEFLGRFLGAMPLRYPMVTDRDAAVAHARLVREHLDSGALASVALVPDVDAVQLCVVADDRPGLLADIAAALCASRLQVHGAQIHSCQIAMGEGEPARLAVDVFWLGRGGLQPFSDHKRSMEPYRSMEEVQPALGKLQRDPTALLKGETSADTLLGQRARQSTHLRPGPAVATRILVDDRASPVHTVLEVVTRDRPGLLFALSHAIYSQGLSIALAKIATEGTRVVDVFYVNERNGEKVAPGERTETLRTAIGQLIETLDG